MLRSHVEKLEQESIFRDIKKLKKQAAVLAKDKIAVHSAAVAEAAAAAAEAASRGVQHTNRGEV